MPSVKRIIGTLVVLALGGYLAFDVASSSSVKESREMATSFCTRVKAGSPVEAALALAREDVTKKALHVEVDEMVVSFSGGCHCWITFKGGKAFPRAPACTS
jgi:type II secretory pathway component PulF